MSEPPGAGKTSLAAIYLDSRGVDALWYQPDRGDDCPDTFFHFARVARIAAQAMWPRHPLPVFVPENTEDVTTASRRFFRQGFSLSHRDLVVSLANYQEGPASSAVHAALASICHECPDGSGFPLLSHTPPPAAFARVRAYQKLTCTD